jgi:RNase P/RNase MRP subunit p29
MKLLLTLLTLAQEAEEPIVIYKKKTEIDFEAFELEGELVKPQGNLILERKKANFNPLIKLRKDFTQEINQSIGDIQ